jgi:hypothetical protein
MNLLGADRSQCKGPERKLAASRGQLGDLPDDVVLDVARELHGPKRRDQRRHQSVISRSNVTRTLPRSTSWLMKSASGAR